MSVYATLMCERGRSSDDRAVSVEEKNGCVFPLWNISTPASSGVIGVMACCGAVRIRPVKRRAGQLTMITRCVSTLCEMSREADQRGSDDNAKRAS